MKTVIDMRVRRATRDDVHALCGLLIELAELEPDLDARPGRLRMGLEKLIDAAKAAVFVAVLEDTVCGMCTVQSLMSTAEGGLVGLVEDVVVKRGMRREGIGSALMAAAENWARAYGLTRLQLLADSGNKAALKFYESIGWDSTRMICLRKKPL